MGPSAGRVGVVVAGRRVGRALVERGDPAEDGGEEHGRRGRSRAAHAPMAIQHGRASHKRVAIQRQDGVEGWGQRRGGGVERLEGLGTFLEACAEVASVHGAGRRQPGHRGRGERSLGGHCRCRVVRGAQPPAGFRIWRRQQSRPPGVVVEGGRAGGRGRVHGSSGRGRAGVARHGQSKARCRLHGLLGSRPGNLASRDGRALICLGGFGRLGLS